MLITSFVTLHVFLLLSNNITVYFVTHNVMLRMEYYVIIYNNEFSIVTTYYNKCNIIIENVYCIIQQHKEQAPTFNQRKLSWFSCVWKLNLQCSLVQTHAIWWVIMRSPFSLTDYRLVAHSQWIEIIVKAHYHLVSSTIPLPNPFKLSP